MAFALRNLSVLAYANGFTLWHYRAGDDAVADVRGVGFLDEAGDMLTAGDMLMVSAATGAQVFCMVPGPQGMLAAPLG